MLPDATVQPTIFVIVELIEFRVRIRFYGSHLFGLSARIRAMDRDVSGTT